MKVVLIFAIVCIALANAAPIRTVEGIWTDSKYGGKLYMCVDDDNQLWATYSEAGVLWGRTSEDRSVTVGNWLDFFLFNFFELSK